MVKNNRNRIKSKPAAQTQTQKLNGQNRTITTTPGGKQADTSRYPSSGLYKPIPHIWFQHPVDLPPFTFATVRAMLMDEGIRLNFETRAAPIYGLTFGWEENGVWQEGIKCRDPGVAQFIFRQLQRIWKTFLPEILRSQIWGWSAGEVTLKLSEETGLIEINEMLSRHPMDCKLLKRGCERYGVRIERVEGGNVDLPFPYSWFHSYGSEDGEDYGTSAAYGAYSSWADKWFEGGAREVRRLFMHKDAYGGVDLTYPDGETYITGFDTPIPNKDIARQIVENIRAGGVTVRPSDRDENGNEKWTLSRATVASNPSHILQYPKDLDEEIRHGMGICDDVINSDSTGAWAGKKIPMQSFYSTLDSWVVKLLKELCVQLIDPLLVLNFGRKVEYETAFKPLAKQAMEQQGQGDGGDPNGVPQDMQGNEQPGQTGIPGGNDEPQPQPQADANAKPVGMSLADQVGSGAIDVRDLVSRAKELSLLRLSSATGDQTDNEFDYSPERIEALADILASIYGDKAEEVLDAILPEDKPMKLALWNPSDHPRGKNGQFVAKGTEEAYSLAKEKVDSAHRSRSPDSMSELMSHLNTLTTKQLHSLKKDYGTKASAKTKSALIAKLTERLTSGKHRTAEREDGTPVAPVRENVYTVPTGTLNVDPARFQYKVKGIGEKGVGEELKGTSKWVPELGGVLLVWRDPENGKDFVINGHHRHELATRAGTEQLNARYIDAPTAKHARAIGALANIAQGHGTAIDAAKYLRDSGKDVEHLKRSGISMSGRVASDAASLVDLSDKSFAAVAQGKMEEDKAVAVAKHLKDHTLQDKLFKKIWQLEDDGKDWSIREVEAASKKMSRAGIFKDTGTDLFGDWESEESTFDQEVELESFINRAFATEANDFAAVSSTRRAERVSETGNVLNVDANLQKRDSARASLSDFDREVGLKGPVAEAIKAQAARLAKATKKADRESIKKTTLDEVRKVLSAMQSPEPEKPGITLDTRTNEAAKPGDQLGMFGEVDNVPGGKPTLDRVGETKGRSVGLFETDGDPDQMLLFDDGVATPDRTWKPDEKRKTNYAIAMSLTKQTKRYKGLATPIMWTLTEDEAKQVEAGARTLIRMQDSDQDTIMMSLGRLQEENRVLRMGVDATGHKHKDKGPGGGQFTKGDGGGGGSDSKPQKTQESAPTSQSPKAPAAVPQADAPAAAKPLPVSAGAVNKEGRDTFEQHQVNGQWSPERQKLHQEIVDKHFSGKKPAPKGSAIAYVLGGGPASGKSSIVNGGHVAIDPDTIHIDSDAIKAELPEYNEMLQAKDHRAASHVHEESSHVAKMIQDKASRGGYHTLLDGTGDSSFESLKGKIDKMRASGQRVVGQYVTVPTELAIQRNIERAKKTGRLPPESMLRACHSSVSAIVPQAIEAGLFDQFDLWDTENGVVNVAKVENGKLNILDQKLWEKFKAKAS